MNTTVYFDNGATTFPKPQSMYRAMLESMEKRGGNPGRAGHSLSLQAARDMYLLRERAADFFGCPLPEQVVATFNATHAINLAIKSLLDFGDTVVYSDMEHNAVRRPIISLTETKNVKAVCFKSYDDDEQTMNSFIDACKRSDPKVVITIHRSNVCQRKMPIEKMGKYCKEKGIFFIVDGAQSGGHDKIDLDGFGIDALCLAGHKGLYGPMGTGLLLVSRKFADHIKKRPTLLDGGSGIDSVSPHMPAELPERYECGTIPSPLFAGLCASIRFVEQLGLDYIKEKENRLYRELMDILTSNDKITVCLPKYPEGSVISFNIKGLTPSQTADLFNQRGIFMRSGLHCSPLAHQALGTFDTGGTVRISLGVFNSQRDIELFYRGLKDIISIL